MEHDLPRLVLAALLVTLFLYGPAAASSPSWIVEKNAAAVWPSYDGSVIAASGDNLLFLTRGGGLAWTGMAYDSVDLTKDGAYVIAGGPHAVLFDRKGTILWEIDNTGDSPSSGDPLHVQIARSGTLVLTWTSQNFHTWDISGREIGGSSARLATPGGGGLTGAAVTPAGDMVILFTKKGIFSVNRSGYPLRGNTDDWKCSVGILFPDGETVACGNENHLSVGYSSGTLLWDKSIASDTITGIAASGGNDPLIAAASRDGKVYALTPYGHVLWEYPLFSYNAGQPVTVSVTRDGSSISATTLDPRTMKGAVFLFDRKGTLVWSAEDDGAVCALDPDGDYLYVGTDSGLSAYAIASLKAGPVPGSTILPAAKPLGTLGQTTTAPAPSASAVPVAAETPGPARTIPQPTQKAPVPLSVPVGACIILLLFFATRGRT